MQINIITICFLLLLSFNTFAFAATPFNNLDGLSATAENSIPASNTDWTYTLFPDGTRMRAGWQSTKKYTNSDTYNNFYMYPYSPNNSSETYGYLEIDDKKKVSGNSLKFTVTGGQPLSLGTPSGPSKGLPVYNKQQYLDYINAGTDPVYRTGPAGSPYIYFGNTSPSQALVPFEESQGANRFSFYIWVPEGLSIGSGGYLVQPNRTIQIGPYSPILFSTFYPTGDPDHSTEGSVGGHWYHHVTLNGGGWMKIVLDTHPQHSNMFSAGLRTPFAGNGFRDLGAEYFNNLYRFYIATFYYDGFTTPPFNFNFDEMQFENDSEPQNNETINSPAVMYNPKSDKFEMSFNGKYVNGVNWGTYEVRYSSAPITNANWSTATPVHILRNDNFSQQDRTDGKFSKNQPYYVETWTSFRLSDQDQAALHIGQNIYFAIKDISQQPGNDRVPITPLGGVGTYPGGGRDYSVGTSLDYIADSAAMPLIKRIDYQILEYGSTSTNGICGPSNGLALPSAPLTGLCSAGTASTVTGTGPWSWTCAGSGGGGTASCGATLAVQSHAISVKLGSGGKMTGILR